MEEEHHQHQQNDFDGSNIISQEDRAPANANVQQWKKWTKQMNETIISCFYNTTLRIPNQSYRKEFQRRWKEIYPEDSSTEQRICDQRSQITKRAESNNIGRGNWLTTLEINQIKDQKPFSFAFQITSFNPNISYYRFAEIYQNCTLLS